jgi:hypothetical protein
MWTPKNTIAEFKYGVGLMALLVLIAIYAVAILASPHFYDTVFYWLFVCAIGSLTFAELFVDGRDGLDARYAANILTVVFLLAGVTSCVKGY